jgi:hypothetical protein
VLGVRPVQPPGKATGRSLRAVAAFAGTSPGLRARRGGAVVVFYRSDAVNCAQAAAGMFRVDVPVAVPLRSVVSRTRTVPGTSATSTQFPPLEPL